MVAAPPPGKRPLKTLERVLSKAGAGSRTEARSWIGAGRVRVNGRVVRDPDAWVDLERDRVDFDGKPGTETMQRLGLDPHVRTGSGGFHQYIVHPGVSVKTFSGKGAVEFGRQYPGVDV